jgi:hypothetical protein
MRPKLKDWHELMPFVNAVYDPRVPGRPFRPAQAGCCWHVLLDDGNFGSVEFCAEVAATYGCAPCLALVPLARLASPTQLRKAAHHKAFCLPGRRTGGGRKMKLHLPDKG